MGAAVTAARAAATTLVLTMVVACAGSAPPDGQSERRTLRLGSPTFDPDLNYTPAIQFFVERVAELSQGRIEVEPVFGPDDGGEYWAYLPDGEQQVVRAVAHGELDLGWSATRVMDLLGAPAFGALQAPLVVDSYALQEAVLRSELLPTLLTALDGVGVRGLTLLAGGLRRPVGVAGPFLGPADYAGKTFQHYPSRVQAATVRALGATPTDVVSTARDEGLAAGRIDGHEHSLNTYVIRRQAEVARYVTANVVLWPEMLALMASPDLELHDRERDWLQRAADDAAARSAALVDGDDERAVEACRQGALLAAASPAQLASLADAVRPVVEGLHRAPETRAVLQAVLRLKRSVTAPPLAVPAGCAVG